MNSVEKGREIYKRVREGSHCQGDGYVAGVFFFVNDDPRIVKEGLDLVKYSLDQAIKHRGCGRHIIPTEEIARQQVAGLFKYQNKLSKVLRRFSFLFYQRELNEHEAKNVLLGIFLDTMIPLEDLDDSSKHKNTRAEAQHLADYFLLELSTLLRALKLL